VIVKVKVTVTESDIDNGIRGDCWKCPVALAMWRATGWKWAVGETRMHPIGRAFFAQMPDLAQRFIGYFDDAVFTGRQDFRGQMVDCRLVAQPFEFEIDVPEEYVVGAGTITS